MKKNYILDTNVLLHDPGAMLSFADNNVIVPIQVVEEVDHFKKEMSELGRNARRVSQLLDGLRREGRLSEGVALAGGGTLRVMVDAGGELGVVAGLGAGDGTVDNAILVLALHLQRSEPELPLILITKDTNLRIKADAMGLVAEDFETGRVRVEELDPGDQELAVEPGLISALRSEGSAALPPGSYRPNEYVLLRPATGGNSTALARVSGAIDRLEVLGVPARPIWGIKPRNKEQHYAMDALLDDRIQLVTLMGKAGTGKTLLALAAGLEKVESESRYHRLLISRPIFPVGKDVGFLPGGLEAKLAPWMQPIHDNLTLLLERTGVKDVASELERLLHTVVSVEPITYIRGRSIPNQYIVVDESQNLTPLEVKTIITRVGEGTKIVLTGDSYQIDNPYVDASSNGFNYVVHKFRDQAVAAHVVLRRGERSELAELASNLL